MPHPCNIMPTLLRVSQYSPHKADDLLSRVEYICKDNESVLAALAAVLARPERDTCYLEIQIAVPTRHQMN